MRIRLLSGILAMSTLVIGGCKAVDYTGVPDDVPFVATVNQLAPSMTFFDKAFQELATWSFDEAYSGAVLVDDETVALYGMSVPFIALYDLSTGELQTKIDIALGVTNVLAHEQQLYVANKEQNTVTAFSRDGAQLHDVTVGNYPLSMALANDTLYVLNFKSDYLSVIDVASFQEVAQWTVPRSSNGLMINDKTQDIWIGGHGDHTSNNQVLVLDDETGDVHMKLDAPQMPVALAEHDDEISVISHGSNALHRFTKDGTLIETIEIGANPFSVGYFQDAVVTAGYDDNTLYVMQNERVASYETGDGPFQLVIRE